MKTFFFPLFILFLCTAEAQTLDGFSPNSSKTQLELEEEFMNTVDWDAFKTHLKRLTAKPHVAGDKANEEVRDYMYKVMAEAGWESKLYPYDMYMSNQPGASAVELVTPVRMPLNHVFHVPYSFHHLR